MAAAAFISGGPSIGNAGPGTLADSPLFLTNAVEPNILFLIDDSGSMDWGLMTEEEDGLMWLGCRYYYTHQTTDNRDYWVVPTEPALIDLGVAAPYGGVWRARSSSYNKAYYDPTVSYYPWPGEDSNGNQFRDADPAAAPIDPFNPGDGTLNLTTEGTVDTDYCNDGLVVNDTAFYPAMYNAWRDTNGNGNVDAADEHTRIEIRATTLTYNSGLLRTDCALAPTCTYAEEIQNFANWFTYYRKRELVAKAAYGQVAAGASNSRMGLVTLHNNNNINNPIRSMNDDPGSGNKKTLLDALYSMQGDRSTPLRNALHEAGEYLSCQSNDFFTDCPGLTEAQGGACQQNFTLMMTDGFYNGGYGGGVGNADGDDDSEWDSGTAGPYGDNQSNTLADIAMEFYETDIRPGIPNELTPPPSGVDENKEQHVVTYSIAFGVDGDLTEMPANTTDAFAWPAPTTDAAKIDDLRHSAWNGRGEFLSAQDPQQLIDGLRGALTSIQGRTGSSSSVAFNTGSLGTNSQLYLALFKSEKWAGELLAYDLDANTGDIGTVPVWGAADELDKRDLAATPRNILTYDGSDGVAFQWNLLTEAQKSDLRTMPDGTQGNNATGIARQAYLRGDRACEISSPGTCSFTDGVDTYTDKGFRARDSRLADIVHSGPVFAGAPELNWPDTPPFPSSGGDTYSEFRANQASRTGIVYFGGNDGMLHAISQADGKELFAYMPNALFSSDPLGGLHYLSDPAYAHRYAVDLTVSIADVYASTRPEMADQWRTVLVGGLRGGGRGLYALDVTDPSAISEAGVSPANTVLWEFTSADDPDLGHTFSRPSIVPLEGPSNTIRWGVVFGNGYNDLGSGEAKLFILFLEEGIDGTWTPVSDYVEISTGVGNTTDRNGLATPAVIDTDGDGLADRVYAGDIEGNMWAFDLSGSNTSAWGSVYKTGATPKPMYISPANQAITTAPVIVRNSSQPTSISNNPNTLVIFGTGQYLTTADIIDSNTQSFVGVWDSGDQELTQADLVEQTIGIGTTPDGFVARTLTQNTVDYATDHGWYMDLPESGERLVTDPVIRGDLVFFNTTTPNTSPCDAGGSSWLMVADWLTGGAPTKVAFNVNGDGAIDGLDTVNQVPAAGTKVSGIAASPANLANKRYTSTTNSTGGSTIEITEIADLGGPRTGRLSWEELNR